MDDGPENIVSSTMIMSMCVMSGTIVPLRSLTCTTTHNKSFAQDHVVCHSTVRTTVAIQKEPVNYFCLDCEPTAYFQLLAPAIAVQSSEVELRVC